MRFHIGFSKFINPAKLIKWLALITFGLFAFFGIDKYLVHALEPSIGSASDYSSVVDHASSHSNWTTENGKRTINFSIPYGANVNRGYIVLIVSNTIACPNGGTVSGSFYWDMTASNYVKYDYDIFDGQTGGLTFGLQSATNGNGYEYNGTATHSYSYADGNLIQFTSFLNSGFTGLRLAFTNTTLHDLATATVYYKLVPLSLSVQCYESNDDIIINNNQNTQDIINNNNDNTQDIIDNQNQNTQDIIDNQNANLQEQIESQQVCSFLTIDNSSIFQDNYYLDNSGDLVSNNYWGVTNYLDVKSVVKLSTLGNAPSLCFYDSSKTLISCISNNNLSTGDVVLPSNTRYIRASINKDNNKPQYYVELCKNGNQAISDSLTDDNVSGATNTGNSFFDNFPYDDTRGFSSIILAPIQFLRDILTSSASCSPLSIGFNPSDGTFSGSATWSIPCGDILWSKAPGPVVSLWYTIIFGLLGYRVLVDMIRFINKSLNPEDTSEYVMDL